MVKEGGVCIRKIGTVVIDGQRLKIASSHLKKARAIYNLVKLLDVYIAGATEKDENARKETPFWNLTRLRKKQVLYIEDLAE